MSKVELEAKVDALNDEINFLRVLYAAVRTPLALSIQGRESSIYEAAGWSFQFFERTLTLYFREVGSQQGHG